MLDHGESAMAFEDDANVNREIKTWQLSQASSPYSQHWFSVGLASETLTSLNQIFV